MVNVTLALPNPKITTNWKLYEQNIYTESK